MKAFIPIDFGTDLAAGAIVAKLYAAKITDISLIVHGLKAHIDDAKKLQRILKKYGFATKLSSIKYKSTDDMPYNVISVYVSAHEIASKYVKENNNEPVLMGLPVENDSAITNIFGPIQHAERSVDPSVIHVCPLKDTTALDAIIKACTEMNMKNNNINKLITALSDNTSDDEDTTAID